MSESKEINQFNNMVENANSKPMETRISKSDLLRELKRLELITFFKSKKDYNIGRADCDIVDWHHELISVKRKAALTYTLWKEGGNQQ